jgi:hypothetical protein
VRGERLLQARIERSGMGYKLPIDNLRKCQYNRAMRIYFPIGQINNDVLRRLIEKNKKKPPRELHLMVYQMCYVRACRYKSLSAEDVACEVYIKIMKSIMNIDKENPKSYILKAVDNYCNRKERDRRRRAVIDDRIKGNVHKFLMYQIQYGVFEEVNNDNED